MQSECGSHDLIQHVMDLTMDEYHRASNAIKFHSRWQKKVLKIFQNEHFNNIFKNDNTIVMNIFCLMGITQEKILLGL